MAAATAGSEAWSAAVTPSSSLSPASALAATSAFTASTEDAFMSGVRPNWSLAFTSAPAATMVAIIASTCEAKAAEPAA